MEHDIDSEYVPSFSSEEEYIELSEEEITELLEDENRPIKRNTKSPSSSSSALLCGFSRPKKKAKIKSKKKTKQKKGSLNVTTGAATQFSGSRKNAEALVTNLPVLITGARPGEIIIGTKTQSKGVMLKIHSGIVPPKSKDLDVIRRHKDLWNKFLNKLNSIEFFSEMSALEKNKWLEEMEDSSDLYIDDVEGLNVEVIQLAGDFLNLKEEDVELLGSPGAIFPIKKVVEMFPKKPGSEGLKGRHTLIFRRGIWKISVLFKETRKFSSGPLVDIEEGKICAQVVEANKNQMILLFDSSFPSKYSKRRTGAKYIATHKQTVGFLTPRGGVEESGKLFSDRVWSLLLEKDEEYHTLSDINRIQHATRKFTAASYKSLLQKIIRFRAKRIQFPILPSGDCFDYPSDFVLKVCFVELLFNPGSFVPDIQRFVSGVESALKRLVITLFEDAYVPSEAESTTLSLTAGAFMAQRIPAWKPSIKVVSKALDLAVAALNSPKSFMFNISSGGNIPPYILSGKCSSLEAVSALMEEIRSFRSDLVMIRYEVSHRIARKEKTTSLSNRPETMPLEHCVDQHWAPEIVYMFPTNVVYPLKSPGSKPFSRILIRLFSEVTGVNPRRPLRKSRTMQLIGWTENFEEKKFTKAARAAQYKTLLSRQLSLGEMKKHTPSSGQRKLKYTLDKGWIAGMLGAVKIKGRPIALVTLHPEDPEIFVAVRKPSRAMKEAFLTDEREAEAIKEMKNSLRKGILLKQTHPPIPEMKGAKLIYKPGSGDSEGVFTYRPLMVGRMSGINFEKVW